MSPATRTILAIVAALWLSHPDTSGADTLSGYGYTVDFNPTQGGMGWQGSLGLDSGGQVVTLSFASQGAAPVDYLRASLSFSLRPLAVTHEFAQDQTMTNVIEDNGQTVLLTSVQHYRVVQTESGGLLYGATATGVSTLPTFTGVPSAFGENSLSIRAVGGTTASSSNSFRYLSSGIATNSVALNSRPYVPGAHQIGEVVDYQGRNYEAVGSPAMLAALLGYPPGAYESYSWPSPDQAAALTAQLPVPFQFWKDLGPAATISGPLDVELTSEVWTPTFLQPGVRHCAGVDCMVATNGTYVPIRFDISLKHVVSIENLSSTEEFREVLAVPEPETCLMLASGLMVIVAVARRSAGPSTHDDASASPRG